jgi:2-oxoglutarate ferredoxin oxidoreductase subunit delta
MRSNGIGAGVGTGAGEGPGVTGTATTRGHVVIDVDACKGCDLCIDACPREGAGDDHSRGQRHRVPLPAAVTGLHGMQGVLQICPDFVFQVYKLAEPVEVPVDEGDDG